MTQSTNRPNQRCLYSWGEQYDPNDFSGLHGCQLLAGHTGKHKDGDIEYDPDEEY